MQKLQEFKTQLTDVLILHPNLDVLLLYILQSLSTYRQDCLGHAFGYMVGFT